VCECLVPTLDFSRLTTPSGDGDILIEPSATTLSDVVSCNRAILESYRFAVLDTDAASVRKRARDMLCGGSCIGPVVMTGHQPEFIHPGVWAKHVVASRLATSLDGDALNLVVDSDAPNRFALDVPHIVNGRPTVTSIVYAEPGSGVSYEGIGLFDSARIDDLEARVSVAMGQRYVESCMPNYFAAMRGLTSPHDWVDQMVFARQSLERHCDVRMIEHRVSRVWGGVFLADIIIHASRFHRCYNAALNQYRADENVRGANRPIPDLAVDGGRVELPVWVYRIGEPRSRCFVARQGGSVRFYANREEIGCVPMDLLERSETAGDALQDLNGYVLRPRALSLTLWARLFGCDLFIHGIGGAKYDRITDSLIRRYYEVEPPAMACVSATLRVGLPHAAVTERDIFASKRRLRDAEFNPERLLADARRMGDGTNEQTDGRMGKGTGERTDELIELIERKLAAVRRSKDLRRAGTGDRVARRRVFEEIRDLNRQLSALQPSMHDRVRGEWQTIQQQMADESVAMRRDFFFGLYREDQLEQLCNRLVSSVANSG
jgi:hypothetical protein